ncbi:MAG: NAD(P)-binding protein [Candidatus Binataceae bacterium]
MTEIVIVGGGPAGLAAAHEAAAHGASSVVLERLERVGGLARTVERAGSRWDIGPHRFFTRNQEIRDLFAGILAADAIRVPRMTRILYGNSYFNYPLTPVNAMAGVGVLSGASILSSYMQARLRRFAGRVTIDTFEDWTVDKFGRRLFEIFFKTYTEKVWGIPCAQIGAEWASQRIKGLSLGSAIGNAIFKSRNNQVKSLIDEFMYPRLGTGQLYEKLAAGIRDAGSRVSTGVSVQAIQREGFRVRCVIAASDTGADEEIAGRFFLSSAPLTGLVAMMQPAPPAAVLDACRRLRYRNHIGVNLLVNGNPFPDNWIYVHSKDVAMARISNYSNFSKDMTGRKGFSPLTVEYFAFPGDSTWTASDADLIERATYELGVKGIVRRGDIADAFVVRNENAYPVIELGCGDQVNIIKAWLDRFENLLPIGRSGMFKYNNQDHAMATGMLAARTALGIRRYDPWLVNIEAEYHEGSPAA